MAYLEVFREHRLLVRAWRWRRRAENHRIVVTSGEGFTRLSSAKRAAQTQFPDDDLRVLPGQHDDKVHP